MSYYTTITHCKKCGQPYSVKVFVDYVETDFYTYDRSGKKVYSALQEPVGRHIDDPKQNEFGYFCDHCGEWNDDI